MYITAKSWGITKVLLLLRMYFKWQGVCICIHRLCWYGVYWLGNWAGNERFGPTYSDTRVVCGTAQPLASWAVWCGGHWPEYERLNERTTHSLRFALHNIVIQYLNSETYKWNNLIPIDCIIIACKTPSIDCTQQQRPRGSAVSPASPRDEERAVGVWDGASTTAGERNPKS